MKFFHIVILSVMLAALGCAGGCDANRAERERARMDQEEKARRDTETANKAITGMNRRIFGQKPEAGEAAKNGPESPVVPTPKK